VRCGSLSPVAKYEQGAWKVHRRFTRQRRTLKWRIEPLPPQPLMLAASAALFQVAPHRTQYGYLKPIYIASCGAPRVYFVQLTALCSVLWQRCLDASAKVPGFLQRRPRLHLPKSDRHLHPSLCISSASVHPPTEPLNSNCILALADCNPWPSDPRIVPASAALPISRPQQPWKLHRPPLL
jgi:hypothetical protein